MAEYPPDSEYSQSVLGWAKEAIEEGDGFLKGQKGYNRIGETIEQVMGQSRDIRSSSLSSASSNDTGRIANDLASALTDVKPFWEYRTSNGRYEQQAANFGKLSEHWWLTRQADLDFTDVVKYALVGATGWAHTTYDERIGDIRLEAEDPRDVLPVRPSGFRSIQDSLAVIIRRERTVNYVRGLSIAEGKEHLIEASRDGSVSSSLNDTRVGRLLDWVQSPFRSRLFSDKAAREMPKIPVLDLYTMYVDDRTKHNSVNPRYMGPWFSDNGTPKPSTNWAYKVNKGELLYPNKRLIVFTGTTVLYDGPSMFWHGLFPIPKLSLDPWPWSFLGKAPLWDILPLQQFLNRLLRTLDDKFEKFARPDIVADKNAMPKAALDRIDTRRAGGKFQTNPLAGKGFQIVEPSLVGLDLLLKVVDLVTQRMESLSGSRDLAQLMRLNQVPGADAMEKMIESMSASVRLRSRYIESFMREFATILAYNFAQFYTLPMRLAVLGEKGMTIADHDFDPKNLIPDYVHSGDFDTNGMPTTDALARGPLPRYNRAKLFMQQFTYHIAPGSLLSASELERKMLFLQLSRMGVISVRTLLTVLQVPNVEENLRELKAEAESGIGLNVSPAGRKSTGQSAPRMVMKES